jgi:flavorubredoxin
LAWTACAFSFYDSIRGAISRVLDPSRLEYVILLHFESDECGGMDRLLEAAPNSALACSAASVQLNLSGWNYRGRVEGHQDGEVIDLGEHKLRFLETPHVHHWDSMMLGGFKWSSQRSIERSCDEQEAGVRSGWATEDALAGSSARVA